MSAENVDLLRAYGPLVRHVVATITARRVRSADLEDLIAEGMVALVESQRRFDAGRSVAFSTFAFHRVRGAVKDALRKLESAGGPRWAPAAAHSTATAWSGGASSAPTGAEGRAAFELEQLPDESLPRPDEAAARLQAARRVSAALGRLPEREQALLRGHYGEELSLCDVGHRLGLSRSGASRLHARAIDKLAHLLEDPAHEPRRKGRS